MRELFIPRFMDRRPYTEWEARKDNAPDWALAKARRILAEHQPEPLHEKISVEMDKVIALEEKSLA
jgi:trimethylamine:corrinoid methyltransferase-like protein